MARYIMANRRAGKFHESEKITARENVGVMVRSMAADIHLVNDMQPEDPTARRIVVFDAEPGEIENLAGRVPADVLIEPEIPHWTDSRRPIDFLRDRRRGLSDAGHVGSGSRLRITVQGGGQPLWGANVLLFLRGPGGLVRELEATTNRNGRVTFTFAPFWQPSAIIAEPAGDFWTMVVRGGSGNLTIECPTLPGDGPLAWWHRLHGVDRFGASRGQGVKVGVIDTGVGPHPCLSQVTDIGAFIDGQGDPGGGADVDSHGTHVCGIIAARPQADGQYAGIAPGVELFSARVFPPNAGAHQGDIADAIDVLSRTHQADLINLSLGAPQPSEIERDAIQDARERGTLCVCAAANSAGPVEWPAAFPETVAVSALGLEGWGPAGSMASLRLPSEPEKFGNENLYLANFSCFGPEITCAGGGVGIISTVPARFGLDAPYAALGGTSMASPAACAALAARLSSDRNYLAMPGDETRSAQALAVLRQHCHDIGLSAIYQGRGVARA